MCAPIFKWVVIFVLLGLELAGCGTSQIPITAERSGTDSPVGLPTTRPVAATDAGNSSPTAEASVAEGPDVATPESVVPFESTLSNLLLGTLIYHGPRNKAVIALTFDACEINAAGYDAGVINALIETHAAATLFLGGKWMLDHEVQTRALARIPFFELANHSYNHPHMAKLTAAQVRDQVVQTQNILYNLTGQRGRLFRFPYGEATATAIEVVQELRLQPIQWDVESGDPNPQVTDSVEIARVLGRARNGSIVIMHMNGRGWHTAQALPTIIAQLRARGFMLVTVSQLLEDDFNSPEH